MLIHCVVWSTFKHFIPIHNTYYIHYTYMNTIHSLLPDNFIIINGRNKLDEFCVPLEFKQFLFIYNYLLCIYTTKNVNQKRRTSWFGEYLFAIHLFEKANFGEYISFFTLLDAIKNKNEEKGKQNKEKTIEFCTNIPFHEQCVLFLFHIFDSCVLKAHACVYAIWSLSQASFLFPFWKE